ncbi:MAG: peptide deformylase [Bacteroidota bacterium]
MVHLFRDAAKSEARDSARSEKKHLPIQPIYTYGADVLRKKAKPVNEVSDEIIKLIYDMMETMRNAGGLGFAANQVGILERVIVVDISGVQEDEGENLRLVRNEPKKLVLINPEVLHADGNWTMEEGCLSIPDVRDEVARPERIRLRYKDANFQNAELECSGLLGRVVLHEIDHIDGILFLDHLSKSELIKHKEQLDRIRRGEIEVAYPIATAEAVDG